MEFDVGTSCCDLICGSQHKKRRISINHVDSPTMCCVSSDHAAASLPTLRSDDYYMQPCLDNLLVLESIDPGYCCRVKDFTVGRIGYGHVKFIGETDVRCLNLDQIVKFQKHEIVVYEDDMEKPAVGQGLNKGAEVTLSLNIEFSNYGEESLKRLERKLKLYTERQGACFISFDSSTGEWKFLVSHFSRFGLSDGEEDDIIMDDAPEEIQDPVEMNGEDSTDNDEMVITDPTLLSHSLPAHLGLDPVRMKEMRMLMFPTEENDFDDFEGGPFDHKSQFHKDTATKTPLQHSIQKRLQKSSSSIVRKTPVALLEYNPSSFSSGTTGTMVMSQQNKGLPVKTTKAEGFVLESKNDTPVTGSLSRNIVDAGLFMGKSFRVGWGPNGVLVHSQGLSSIIKLERVAIDNVVRDESKKIKEELVSHCFDLPLSLHKEMEEEIKVVDAGPFKLKLFRRVHDPFTLSNICRSYISTIEKQLEVSGISSSSRIVLMHQVMVWELIKVLFSAKGQSKPDNEEEDVMDDDTESLTLIRRAEFSYWLQECVCHRVQEEVSSLNDSNDLMHIFFLMTGRQLNSAVEIAAFRGDVRLACLLSQAGGSMMNRVDIDRQLQTWTNKGLDFNYIEEDRIRLFMLLAGNIHGALQDIEIDWKRFMGLLMWYQLPPNTPLATVFRTYQKLIDDGRAPRPVPIYIDEGPLEETANCNSNTRDHFDLAYHLMLLHASDETDIVALKTMFCALASTYDPLDYHMIWHQRQVLEAVGAFTCDDLHVLDMGLVSQLLCLGQCHWAIYVVLHMPYRDDFPNLQATVIREILFQYCETWSMQEQQRQFIEELEVPSAWLHEAMAVYFNYCGDLPKAFEHFLECGNWQKAHSIFVTSVASSLFLSGEHSELWRLATSMEDHKSEIVNWDLGAGLFISFYLLRNSLQEDSDSINELDTLDSKNDACRDFFGKLNKSSSFWGDKLSIDSRVTLSKIGEEISDMLVSDEGENSSRESQLSCYDTVLNARRITEDVRSYHLQDAISVFTCYLSEAAAAASS